MNTIETHTDIHVSNGADEYGDKKTEGNEGNLYENNKSVNGSGVDMNSRSVVDLNNGNDSDLNNGNAFTSTGNSFTSSKNSIMGNEAPLESFGDLEGRLELDANLTNNEPYKLLILHFTQKTTDAFLKCSFLIFF